MPKNADSAGIKKRNLEYKPHLVTYVDILGFRELVATQHPNIISRAIRRVQEITEPDAQIRKTNEESYINFSDLIVHTVPVLSRSNKKWRDGLVFHEINHLALAQVALIEEGILIRGALIMGLIERTYGVLFGPGLISAYELEREQAQYPRIVVDPKLIEALKTNPLLRHHDYDEEMDYISKFIKRDDDGVIFIDCLGGKEDEASEFGGYVEFLMVHKRLIERNLVDFKSNKRVLPKHLWLRKYHNAVVQARLKPSAHEELLVKGCDDATDVPNLMPPFRPLGEAEPDEDLD
jgi:hypothetical protein